MVSKIHSADCRSLLKQSGSGRFAWSRGPPRRGA